MIYYHENDYKLVIQIQCNLKKVSYSGELAFKGEGNGTPLWYSCLGNPMDGGAWWAAVHGVAKRRP